MTHGERLPDSRYAHGLLLEVGARHWRTLRHISPNRVRFVHRAPATADHYDGTHVISEQAYEARMWQHLVAQKRDEDVELWVDGERILSKGEPNPLPAEMRIVIGQLYPHLNHRPFVGQIDEVAVYERALRDEEIQAHLRATDISRYRPSVEADWNETTRVRDTIARGIYGLPASSKPTSKTQRID